jgi:diaminopimelate decarboxylase
MTELLTDSKKKTLRYMATPFYYYRTDILKQTIETAISEANRYGYHIHYAVKANANKEILKIIMEAGAGADCVSGGEIQAVVEAGFQAGKILFAGVGKTDAEINIALDTNIGCFNVESIPELFAINRLALTKRKTANIAFRINPEVDANTHSHITTGTSENKFGINIAQLNDAIDALQNLPALKFTGIHVHIGSQITDTAPFIALCKKVAVIRDMFTERGIALQNINFGGGLGIDYQEPDAALIPDFATYFRTFNDNFPHIEGQKIRFEPGRSIVGQCSALISRVTYVKEGIFKKFLILDAGFTDLIRPAFYGAYHKIENLDSTTGSEIYDVVGPLCESSDCFGKDVNLPLARAGTLIAIRSAGAYGEVMASRYNCRKLPRAILDQ